VALFRTINGLAGNAAVDALFLFLTRIGQGGAVWLALAVLLWLGAGRLPGLRRLGAARWRTVGISMVVALALAGATESGLKLLIGRLRPSYALTGVHVIGAAPASYSFPSGHALSSFAAAMVLVTALRRLERRREPLAPVADGLGAMVLATLISFSRIYVGHHFPLDVLAGMLLGLLEGWAVWMAAERVLTRRHHAASSLH
jgi:undecaprenyl-diphosphatase